MLLVTSIALTKGELNTEPKCIDVEPGRYCNKDLSAFIVCGEKGKVASSICSPVIGVHVDSTTAMKKTYENVRGYQISL